jgi:hypothetical protein
MGRQWGSLVVRDDTNNTTPNRTRDAGSSTQALSRAQNTLPIAVPIVGWSPTHARAHLDESDEVGTAVRHVLDALAHFLYEEVHVPELGQRVVDGQVDLLLVLQQVLPWVG